MTEIFENIKKLYLFELRCAALAPYIEFFSETSIEATQTHIQTEEFTVKLFPSYTPTIWINLGSPYHLKNGDHWQCINETTDVLVLRNEIIERRNLPLDNIFTIKFFPGGLEAIFGISQAKIGSDTVNLNELIPNSSIKKLKNLSSINDRISLLQELFLAKLHTNKKTNHYFTCIQQAIDTFHLSGLELKNKEIVQQLAISDKSMYRYFTKMVGTNPKNFMAMNRARIALTAYVDKRISFSPYIYGYYDMSHFYKDVVKFTGQKLSMQMV
ncbi:helix-turn-helix domain-containing protein [Pedobacter sp. Hv1]|uniref:helix-turn-helix domain-containing protein n=1 Tax=Pedobacter sp. Hv1 TaxID=1740090 RepID=UPI0006D8B26F|nr:helix-turn-helix domain-containing protein [Pedobacter sp. Hv1]KQC00609.1 hypothetical protein AQF98_07940 [Pedobacter sp. Hv1]